MGVIILFGGRSVIGSLVAEGLRQQEDNAEILRVSREITSNFDEIDGFFDSPGSDQVCQLATHVILSVGTPERRIQSSTAWERLQEIFDINVLKSVRFLELLLDRREKLQLDEMPVQIHLVSSLLADFIKPGAIDYSLTKSILDTKIQHIAMLRKQIVFIWRFGFVSSPFHLDGEMRQLGLSEGEIIRRVRRARKPGIHYVPRAGKLIGLSLNLAPKFVVRWAVKFGEGQRNNRKSDDNSSGVPAKH